MSAEYVISKGVGGTKPWERFDLNIFVFKGAFEHSSSVLAVYVADGSVVQRAIDRDVDMVGESGEVDAAGRNKAGYFPWAEEVRWRKVWTATASNVEVFRHKWAKRWKLPADAAAPTQEELAQILDPASTGNGADGWHGTAMQFLLDAVAFPRFKQDEGRLSPATDFLLEATKQENRGIPPERLLGDLRLNCIQRGGKHHRGPQSCALKEAYDDFTAWLGFIGGAYGDREMAVAAQEVRIKANALMRWFADAGMLNDGTCNELRGDIKSVYEALAELSKAAVVAGVGKGVAAKAGESGEAAAGAAAGDVEKGSKKKRRKREKDPIAESENSKMLSYARRLERKNPDNSKSWCCEQAYYKFKPKKGEKKVGLWALGTLKRKYSETFPDKNKGA